MPIAFNRYVNITSGVGAGAAVPRRELIARIFTQNSFVPTGGVLEFTDLADVLNYFGATSEEYLRAQFYFGFVSKNITRPKRISYARWANTDTAPEIYGTTHQTLTQLQAITSGQLSVSLGGVVLPLTGLDFSSDNALADVASTLQAAIRAGTGAVFTGATVTYDATFKRFVMVGGETGESAIVVTAGASNDAAGAVGWLAGAVLSNGVAAESVTETLTESTQLTNNFGSFRFMDALSHEQVGEAARWNAAQNVMFMFMHGALLADFQALFDDYGTVGGMGVTELLAGSEASMFHEMMPMAILAATDYTRRASVQNYMYQFPPSSAPLTATVTRTSDAEFRDQRRINYYGQTQTAGQTLEFYQRGVLFGGPTDPVNMNTYANEQWLKDRAGGLIMALLLNLPRVSANANGRGQLLGVIQTAINEALNNGTFSIDKDLTVIQQVYITEQTGDPDAWRQVQGSGYWVDARIESEVIGGITQFTAVYTLIYSKDDVIRSVDGSHILI